MGLHRLIVSFVRCSKTGRGSFRLPSLLRHGDLTPERPIVTYCGHGERAATALSLLQRAGFHELLNLDGGIDGWKEAGYPTIED